MFGLSDEELATIRPKIDAAVDRELSHVQVAMIFNMSVNGVKRWNDGKPLTVGYVLNKLGKDGEKLLAQGKRLFSVVETLDL